MDIVRQPSPLAFVKICSTASRCCAEGSKTNCVSSCRCRHLLLGGVAYFLWMHFFLANFTRFYILARSIDEQLPSAPNPRNLWSHQNSQNKGLVRIREPQHRDPSFSSTHSRFGDGARRGGLTSLLSALDLPIGRLDRRPMLRAKTFAHVYILEVEDDDQSSGSADSSPITPDSAVVEGVTAYSGKGADLQSNKPLARLEDDREWVVRLREAVERVLEAGGDAEVLGCW